MTQPVVPAPTPPASITVYDPNGALVQISPADLPNAQAQGYVVAETPAAEKGAYDLAREKGFGEVQSRVIQGLSPLLSYEQGTVAGATAGIGEGVQRKIAGLVGPVLARATGGPDMTSKEAEEFYRQIAQGGVHSGIHATGEVAGMVGSAVAGGALKGAAGAAGSVGRGLGLLTEAGEGAAAGARAITGGLAARGALGRAAATGIELGVRGGIEMGAYEGVKELSEEMFGDAPLSAQKIFAAAADGAEGGALFGGALGAGGSLVKSAGKGIANTAIQYASRNADTLQDLANEQRWKALDPTLEFTKKAEARVPGGRKAVGGTLREYGVFDGTLADAAQTDGAAVAKRIENAVDQVGQRLGAIQDASPGVVKFGAIDDALDAVIAPIRKEAGREGIVRSLESYKESLASKLLPNAEAQVAGMTPEAARAALRDTEITLQDALFQRQALDKMVYDESKALNPHLRVGLLRDFRSKFEGTIVDAFDDAAKAAGNPSAKAELLKLKGDYQKLKLAQEAAENTSSRMATNRNFSMSDYISGGIASTVGTAAGQAIGGDYGAALGGIAGGALGARINKFGRARGNAIAAAVADRLAAFGGKERILAKLGEAAPALEREAMAADGAAARAVEPAAPVVAEVARVPIATQPALDEALVKRLNGGTVYEEDMPKLVESAKKVFGDKVPTPEAWEGMWRAPPGYKVALDDLSATGKGLKVGGEIRTDGGQQVGNFIREFKREPNGDLVVKHEHLHIDPEFQGKGIASEMQKSAVEAYNDLGVNRIELTAGYDAGPYAWARTGFKFDPGEADMLKADVLPGFVQKAGLNETQVQELVNAIDRSPRAVSELPFGKDFLLETREVGGWSGHLPVAEAHAEMLQKAAEFQRAKDAIAKVDAQLEKSAKGLIDPEPAPAAKQKPLKERYEEARAATDQIGGNLEAVINRANVPANSMPKVSQALGEGVMRAASFLANAGPPPVNPLPTLGAKNAPAVSAASMKDFVDQYEAVNNPMGTLRKFQTGRVTTAEVSALKVVSPELFAELQKRCFSAVIDRQAAGKPIPFQARQRMHVLLGILTDPSQDPKLTKLLQSNFEAPPPQEQAGSPSGSSRPVQLPSTTRTYDRLEEG